MTQTVSAVYENGVLRLEQPLAIADGVKVEILVIAPSSEVKKKSPAELLAKIAAFPSTSDGKIFSGRDHDRILYGDSKDK